jgi:hypothetical protein
MLEEKSSESAILQERFYTSFGYLQLLFFLAFVIDGYKLGNIIGLLGNGGPMIVFFGAGLAFSNARRLHQSRYNTFGVWLTLFVGFLLVAYILWQQLLAHTPGY